MWYDIVINNGYIMINKYLNLLFVVGIIGALTLHYKNYNNLKQEVENKNHLIDSLTETIDELSATNKKNNDLLNYYIEYNKDKIDLIISTNKDINKTLIENNKIKDDIKNETISVDNINKNFNDLIDEINSGRLYEK